MIGRWFRNTAPIHTADPIRSAALALLISTTGAVSALAAQEPATVPAQANASEIRQAAFAAELEGDHGKAADAFLKLCEIESHNADWFVKAADNLGKAGRFNDAAELLDNNRARFPDALELEVATGRLYHLKADRMRAEGIRDTDVLYYYQDTIRVAERVLNADPKHLEATLLRASSLFQLGRIDDAFVAAETAVREHPDDYGGHAMLGRICFHRYLDAQQRMNRERPTGRAKAALIEEINENRKRATDAFQAAAAADPDRAFPHVKLGDIAAWTGRIRPALDHYRTALSIEPRAQLDHGWLRKTVTVEQRLGLYRGAAETYATRPHASEKGAAVLSWYLAQAHYDRAVKADPVKTDPAKGDSAKDDFTAAITLFTATLPHLPDLGETYHYLYRAHYWTGDMAAATAVALAFARKAPRGFADTIREDDQTRAVLRGMAASLYRDGELEDSRDLNQVIAYADQTAQAWNNYAFLCRETQAYERSFAAYEQALTIDPDSPQLLNDAGVILHYHLESPSNKERARKLYERAVEMAEKRLADGGLSEDELAITQQALNDARNNLRVLGPAKQRPR